jgi:hypothetical protein
LNPRFRLCKLHGRWYNRFNHRWSVDHVPFYRRGRRRSSKCERTRTPRQR